MKNEEKKNIQKYVVPNDRMDNSQAIFDCYVLHFVFFSPSIYIVLLLLFRIVGAHMILCMTKSSSSYIAIVGI